MLSYHKKISYWKTINVFTLMVFTCTIIVSGCRPGRNGRQEDEDSPALKWREITNIDEGWKFFRYPGEADKLMYDVRPVVTDRNDNIVADSKPTASVASGEADGVLKKWILPSGNDFFRDPAKKHVRPGGNPGADFPFVQPGFDDAAWQDIDLPHDWAIAGPFYREANAVVGGGMGRLPVQGVAWYRRKLESPASDQDKMVYLEVEGAMSYAMVWLNSHLVGGWPYGYNTFRLDLTPYLKRGGDNQLAIRIATNKISFSVTGPGEIVATDNGDPADLEAFPSKERNAFSGMALVIVRAKPGAAGRITVTASAAGIAPATTTLKAG